MLNARLDVAVTLGAGEFGTPASDRSRAILPARDFNLTVINAVTTSI